MLVSYNICYDCIPEHIWQWCKYWKTLSFASIYNLFYSIQILEQDSMIIITHWQSYLTNILPKHSSPDLYWKRTSRQFQLAFVVYCLELTDIQKLFHPPYHNLHYDVIKWKHFPRYWLFVRWIHWSPVNSPPKNQWRGALMFSVICVWVNDWVNNCEAGDLRPHRGHHDVTVMFKARFRICQH